MSQELIVTCAHVVQGVAARQSGARAPDTISVVAYGMADVLKARIEADWWRDADADDVAFLRLEAPVPDYLRSLPLGSTENCKGHDFETLGFPALNPKDGLRGVGHILGSVRLSGSVVLQISSNEVTPGFSGAPVWDVAAGRVVGMVCKITSADAYGKLTETAFVTPTETLQSVCPEIKPVDICPYRGLMAFTEADAKFFFGRDELVEELAEHLRHSSKLLAVVGSSGSGKSSLVQAGLIPHLRQVAGFEKSQVVYFRPGAAPLDALRRALAACQIAIKPSCGIVEMADQIVETSRTGRVVLLADQFEEVFALSPDSERMQFIGCLANLINGASSVTLVLTLRADFYDQLLRSQLGQLVKFGQAIVLPMSRGELESAIRKPAEAIGLQLEPGLTDRILEESADIEQPLPLLEFALTQLWEQREKSFLTHSAYSAIGRVGGALGSWATDAYTSLVPRDRDLARRIFTNLVHFGKSGAPDTRRRLSLDDLTLISRDPDSVRRIVLYLAS